MSQYFPFEAAQSRGPHPPHSRGSGGSSQWPLLKRCNSPTGQSQLPLSTASLPLPALSCFSTSQASPNFIVFSLPAWRLSEKLKTSEFGKKVCLLKKTKKHMWKEMLSSSPKCYTAGLDDTLQAMPATCHMNVSSTHRTALGLPRIRPND